jgi:multidrug resistance protein MdtO
MSTLAQSVPASSRSLSWLWDLLREELAPYPGRGYLVARMITAATLVMIINMTYRTPYGVFGVVYALSVSRESLGATTDAVRTLAISFTAGGAFVLLGAMLLLGDPMLRILWVIGALFAIFYAMSVLTNYSGAAQFAYMVVITIPLWDEHIRPELKVEGTLWAVWMVAVSSIITLLIELIFRNLRPGDELTESIADRLLCVEKLLASYANGQQPDEATTAMSTRLALTGTSRLRRMLQRTAYAPEYGHRMGAIVALVGRIVDIAANLTQFRIEPDEKDRERMRKVAERIAAIRDDLMHERVSGRIEFAGEDDPSSGVPLLRELERSVSLIPEVFAGHSLLNAFVPVPSGASRPKTLFVADALSNPDHVKFALRGCLAASLCYIAYNAVAWPGISTSVTTCVLTALTTIGASRQKQVLRIAGALVGGIVISMGAQVYILPYLDSIAGFTVLFLAVSIPAAWIFTSGPRLSYFGYQIAIAFYLINLQEFHMQRSLAVARDRVAGVVLGLFMMWLVYDRLWGTSAVVEMKRTFIASLRLLAQFVREPLSGDRQAAIERSYSLRDTIHSHFDQARAQADGVLFEFGSSRQQDLALRSRIISWQPQLRMLFVLRIALLKYRLRLPGFELPDAVLTAQQEFDDGTARELEKMADQMEGGPPRSPVSLGELLDRLEDTIRACSSDEHAPASAGPLQTLISLSRTTEGLMNSLDRELDLEPQRDQ